MLKILSGISDGQVLQQRGARGARASLVLQGCDRNVLTVSITHNGRPLPSWKDRRLTAPGKIPRVTLRDIPAGGPYALHIRCGDQAVAVPSFYVGDVWLLAGQSNMEGTGNMSGAAAAHPLVQAFSMRREWRPAKEPLHLRTESPDVCHNHGRQLTRDEAEHARASATKGAGVGLPFARLLVAATGIPQGLICTAHGGTTMKQWDPERAHLAGESLYASMLASVRATGQPVAGMLWYQGESDSRGDGPAEYTGRMLRLVAAVRRDLRQPRLPWLLVQAARFLQPRDDAPAGWNSVQEQQRLLPGKIRHFDVVAAVDLPMDDPTHVGADGFSILAGRLANAAERLVFHKRGALPTPQPRDARLLDPGKIEVRFSGISGGLRSAGEPHGFAIVNSAGDPIPHIYRTTLSGNSALLHVSDLPAGASVAYGQGFAPVCNVGDDRDHAVPVFGPLPIIPDAAWLPFVTAWSATEIQPATHPLTALDLRKIARLAFTPRTWNDCGMVNEHPRWERKSGQAFFRTSLRLPEPMDLEVLCGYDGPFRLWIDDAPFYTDPHGTNPCVPDQGRKRIRLDAGKHQLMVGMDLNGGQAWGFYLRFKRRDVTKAQIASGDYAKPVYEVAL